MFTVVRMVTHVKQGIFMQGDRSPTQFTVSSNIREYSTCISETKPFRAHVYMDFFTRNKPKNRSVQYGIAYSTNTLYKAELIPKSKFRVALITRQRTFKSCVCVCVCVVTSRHVKLFLHKVYNVRLRKMHVAQLFPVLSARSKVSK